jgi:ABC-type amino acid transport substrate-binding protein
MRFFKIIKLCLLVFLLNSCGKKTDDIFEIGIDPTFFPLTLNNEAVNILAYSNDLISEISKLEKFPMQKVMLSWDNLVEALYLEKVKGIFSSASPNLINNTKFSFSEPFLMTGPVLITQLGPTKLNISDFHGKVIAMGKTSEELDLLKENPEIEFVFYDSIVDGLEGVVSGKYNASLIPVLPATAYIKDLFQTQLMISSKPLTNQALRLLTIKDAEPKLMKAFDKGLKRLKDSGELKNLLIKWSLPVTVGNEASND